MPVQIFQPLAEARYRGIYRSRRPVWTEAKGSVRLSERVPAQMSRIFFATRSLARATTGGDV